MIITFSVVFRVYDSDGNSYLDQQVCSFHYNYPSFFFIPLVTPLMETETGPGVSGPRVNCLKEVAESPTLSPLGCPNSYLAELQSDPMSLLFTAETWLDSLPQVISNCPSCACLQYYSLST